MLDSVKNTPALGDRRHSIQSTPKNNQTDKRQIFVIILPDLALKY